jgi:hypothetical protein
MFLSSRRSRRRPSTSTDRRRPKGRTRARVRRYRMLRAATTGWRSRPGSRAGPRPAPRPGEPWTRPRRESGRGVRGARPAGLADRTGRERPGVPRGTGRGGAERLTGTALGRIPALRMGPAQTACRRAGGPTGTGARRLTGYRRAPAPRGTAAARPAVATRGSLAAWPRGTRLPAAGQRTGCRGAGPRRAGMAGAPEPARAPGLAAAVAALGPPG